MGYTHYFTVKENLTPKEFNSISDDLRRLLDNCDDVTAEIKDNSILVDDNFNYGESFFLPRVKIEEGFNFCKTGHEKYDTFITALLIAIGRRTDKIAVSSDGEFDKDWQEGARLFEKTFKKSAVNPL